MVPLHSSLGNKSETSSQEKKDGSSSSGGDGSLENVTTLPNILREFNRNLTGYAVGTGDASDMNAFLNQAVPGAKAEYDIWGGREPAA
ncbi:Phospholipase B1, membrane-associated [Plecturocebus cupreus]